MLFVWKVIGYASWGNSHAVGLKKKFSLKNKKIWVEGLLEWVGHLQRVVGVAELSHWPKRMVIRAG